MEVIICIRYSEREAVLCCSKEWLDQNKWITDAIKGEFRTDLDPNKVGGGKGYLFNTTDNHAGFTKKNTDKNNTVV